MSRGGSMAVRRLKKSHQNVTGRFFSVVLNRHVQFDSLLERDFILLLDMHPVIRWFAEQPLKIPFSDGSAGQFYVPDFLIEFHGGSFMGRNVDRPWIVEMKYCSDLITNWRKIRPKIRAGFREASRRASQFRIVTETRILSAGLENARFLRRHLNSAISSQAMDDIVRFVRAAGQMRISDLTLEPTLKPHAVWSAIAKKLLTFNFDQRLGPETVVWVREPDADA